MEVELSDYIVVWVEVEGGRHSWMEPKTSGERLVFSQLRISGRLLVVSVEFTARSS